jgi:filamin
LLVGADSIYNGNIKLILGLIFALILHYDVFNGKSLDEENSLMLKWINIILPSCNINNLTTDWNDGIFLSALVNYCKPGLIPGHASMDPSKCLENVTNAMNQAERELGVPQVIQPEDMATDKPDGLLVVMYLSGFCCPGSTIQKGLIDWVNSQIPGTPVSNLSKDWFNGRKLAALVDALTQGGFPKYDRMKKKGALKNCQDAMEAAEKLLKVEQTVSPREFTMVDHLTCSMYLMQLQCAVIPPKPTLASTLEAAGPGISGDVAGTETNFVVSGPRIPKWAKVDVVVKSSDGTVVPTKKHMVDTKAVQFHYTPEEPGDYAVHVTVNGEPIPDSAFDVTHKANSKPSLKLRMMAGMLQMKGTALSAGALSVEGQGPHGPIPITIEEDCGIFSVHYLPTSPGQYSLDVLLDGQSIPSSPFTMHYEDASANELQDRDAAQPESRMMLSQCVDAAGIQLLPTAEILPM